MSLEKYSGGPNPFLIAQGALSKWADKKRDMARDISVHRTHEETLQMHKEMETMTHQHAKDLMAAHVEGKLKEISAYHKLAQPGTPLQVQTGDTSVSMTTRTPKQRAPKAPAKVAKPLPVRDPKTGRAMKAPQ